MTSFKKKHLITAHLTFQAAIETAVGVEQVELDTKEYKCSVGVHKFTYKPVRGTSRSEFGCGHRSGASSRGFGRGGNNRRHLHKQFMIVSDVVDHMTLKLVVPL